MAERLKNNQLQGYRKVADNLFGYGYWLFAGLVLVQLFLAGGGTFGSDFSLHSGMSVYLSGLATLLLVLSVVARRSWAVIAGAAVVIALIEGVQRGLTGSAWGDYSLGGLHALGGSIVLLLAVWLAYKATQRTA